MNKYEAMWLFDAAMSSDFDAVEKEIGRLLERAGANLIVSSKWDERRLAYEVQGRKRGLYVLTFFEADASKIAGLERDVQLSETVLRILVLSANDLTEEEMREVAARPADHSAAEADRISGRWNAGHDMKRKPASSDDKQRESGVKESKKPEEKTENAESSAKGAETAADAVTEKPKE